VELTPIASALGILADTLQVPAVTIGDIRFLLYASEEKWFVVERSAFGSAGWVAEAHFLWLNRTGTQTKTS
jgi:hypothetical protein